MLRTNQRTGPWAIGAAFLIAILFFYLSNSASSWSSSSTPDVTRQQDASKKGSSKPLVHSAEVKLDLDVLQYTRTLEGAKPDLLWLSLTYDNSSWGKNDDEDRRTVKDFLRIVSSQYDTATTSLGLLTSSMDEYNSYKSVVQEYNFPRVVIFMHPGFHDGPTVDRDHRHDGDVQTIRRAEISKLRNYLMLRSLRDEQHILWVDADVFKLDRGIVKRMVRHVTAREDVGILTARCSLGGMDNYDLNAWSGTRQGPRGWDLDDAEIAKGELELQGQHHVSELIKDTSDDDLIQLQTVGATILYMRASLIWRGLNFPHQYVVGTRWDKDGWDGIESEGLCYRARGLSGGKCMVLGGTWHVEHTTG